MEGEIQCIATGILLNMEYIKIDLNHIWGLDNGTGQLEYYETCKEIGEPVDLLYVESEFNFPVCNRPKLEQIIFLGIDVGQEDYSLIYNDIPRINELRFFA